MALIHISEKLKGLDARVVHTQHDEIIVEAREDSVDHVKSIIKEMMEAAFKQIISGSRLLRSSEWTRLGDKMWNSTLDYQVGFS